jgi:cytochrome c peroxidase
MCSASTLELQFSPSVSGDPLQAGSLRYQTAAHEPYSVTRLSWLATDFALESPEGHWTEYTNSAAWLDLERGRERFQLLNVAPGSYRSVRFHIGVDPVRNHANITNFPPNHALNPNLNGLHWSWQGGYVFLALEGHWRDGTGKLDGWSYHLARDTNRVRIHLPVSLDLSKDTALKVDIDIGTALNAPRAISFAREGSASHSRDGDPVASALVANLPGAFRVRQVLPLTPTTQTTRITPLYLPEHATPYPFQMSGTFPIPALPRDNPLTVERVALGKALFHDTALSKDNTLSCASCHEAKAAFTDPRQYSVGVRGQVGARNAMPLFNLAWKSTFFWDGRAPSLRAQTLMPIQDPSEMDETLPHVVEKLGGQSTATRSTDHTERAAQFTAAFGSPEVTAEKIGLALEAFVLTLTSFDSKYDRVTRGNGTFSEEERRGFELFMTEYDPRREQFGADCFHCHGGPLFQSQTFANNGLDTRLLDVGRAKVTGKPADQGKFATPSLRNVSLTGPYMHDGRFATLEQVVEHYSTGVKRSPTLDPNLAKHPDGGVPLSAEDKRALVAFLKTLTDPKYGMGEGR